MATDRFPKKYYVRQLQKVADELWQWQASYKTRMGHEFRAWQNGRLDDRQCFLETLAYDLDEVIDRLKDTPRLS
jgi:hypothetical protein